MEEKFFDAPGYFLDRHNVEELAHLRRDIRNDEKFQLIASIETSSIDKVIHFARTSRQQIEITIVGAASSLSGEVIDHFSDGLSIRENQRKRVHFVPRRKVSTIRYLGDFILPIDFEVEPNPMWTFISNQLLDQEVIVYSWGRRYGGILYGVGDEIVTLKTTGHFDRVALRIRDIDQIET